MTFLFKGGIENEVKVCCRERSSLLGRPSKKMSVLRKSQQLAAI